MNENKLPELKKKPLLYHPKSHEKNIEKHVFLNGDGVFFLNPSQLRHPLFAPPLVSPPRVLGKRSGRSHGFRTGRLVGGSRLGGAQDFVVFEKVRLVQLGGGNSKIFTMTGNCQIPGIPFKKWEKRMGKLTIYGCFWGYPF